MPKPPKQASRRTSRSRIALAAALGAATAVSLVAGAPAQAATPSSTVLSGTQPSWATPQTDIGAAPSSTPVSVDVFLASRNPSALAAYATSVSDPKNANYHKYLTPQQQNAQFGPSSAQVSAVQSWLASAGLKVGTTTEQYITATGGPAAVQAAFGTTLNNYAVSGHTYFAPKSNAVVPAAVSGDVLGVEGLDNAPHAAKAANTPTPGNGKLISQPGQPPYIGISPCATYYGQSSPTGLPAAYGKTAPNPVCGYLPNQIRDAYQVNQTGLSGKGQTVAVVDWYQSPTLAPDVAEFDKENGVTPFRPGQFTTISNPAQWNSMDVCGPVADDTPEQSLDVESVHTMAPDANVVYVGANSCNDSDLIPAEANIVDHRLATVVSNSWLEDLFDTTGNEPVADINAYTQLFEQGAVEGIGFYFAAGDCSTNAPAIVSTGLNCDPNSTEAQVSFPSSDPWATSVGGTAIGIGKSNNYEFETGMGDSSASLNATGTAWTGLPGAFIFGSGGGTSNYFTQPVYQRAVVPASLADTLLTGQKASQPMREIPDVAMEGDLLASTVVGFTQALSVGTTGFAEAGYGGTSVATPLFAGEQADAQQAQGGLAIGFANPEIYFRYLLLGQFAFHDVTDHPGGTTQAMAINDGVVNGIQQGTLITIGADYTLHATPGYDDVTGVGSPSLGYLRSFSRL
jgi:subtilase family serine protease